MSTLNELLATARIIRDDCAERLSNAGRHEDAKRVANCPVKWGAKMTRVAGYAHHNRFTGECHVRLSKPLYSLPQNEPDFEDTVRHEFAHIAMAGHPGASHGPEWRATCILVGGSGERCHKMKILPQRVNPRVVCQCPDCGKHTYLGPAQASRVHKYGAWYPCTWCNGTSGVKPPYGWSYAAMNAARKAQAQQAQ